MLEWFENSARRDGKALEVVEIWNAGLRKHLIVKRGFRLKSNGDVVKNIKRPTWKLSKFSRPLSGSLKDFYLASQPRTARAASRPTRAARKTKDQRTNQPAGSTVIRTSLPSDVSGRPVTPLSDT